MNEATNKPHCCKRVFSSGGSVLGHICGRAAKLEYESRPYCSVHYPPNVAAKDKARQEKWDKEWADKQAGWKAAEDRRAEIERRAELFDDLLAALKLITELYVLIPEEHWTTGIREGFAAIAKAEKKS